MLDYKSIIARPAVQIGGASAVSLAVGIFAGYKVAARRLDSRYSEILDREINEAKRFYSALNKTDAFSSPEKVAEAIGVTPSADNAAAFMRVYQGLPEGEKANLVLDIPETDGVEDEPEDDAEVNSNVFEKPEFDYETELANRDTSVPYLITDDEFMEGAPRIGSQSTLTYYAGDDILADEHDRPVDDVERTVGDSNLERFGEGSNDSRIVYVRNERIGVDFEIILHSGTYSEVVIGIPADDQPKRRTTKVRRSADE